MTDLQFIREEAEFMDNQVEYWMDRLAIDPDLEVPSIVLKYFFYKAADERPVAPDRTPSISIRQRRPFGHRLAHRRPRDEELCLMLGRDW